MNSDNLIYELDYNQKIGEELANKLNGDYVINTIEITLDKIDDKTINSIYISNCIIDLHLNYFYNNIYVYNVCPIYYQSIDEIDKFIDNDIFCINISEDEFKYDKLNEYFKLKITLKKVLKRYYYSLDEEYLKNNKINIFSGCLNDYNDLKSYFLENSEININDFINILINYSVINDKISFYCSIYNFKIEYDTDSEGDYFFETDINYDENNNKLKYKIIHEHTIKN